VLEAYHDLQAAADVWEAVVADTLGAHGKSPAVTSLFGTSNPSLSSLVGGPRVFATPYTCNKYAREPSHYFRSHVQCITVCAHLKYKREHASAPLIRMLCTQYTHMCVCNCSPETPPSLVASLQVMSSPGLWSGPSLLGCLVAAGIDSDTKQTMQLN
jgi:hypothetical protein